MSTGNRAALHASLIRNIRYFIAGTIVFNQKVADSVGLHLTDMQCLNLLELEGAMTPGKLAKWMGLSTGGVTVMLDRLEQGGYIRREANPCGSAQRPGAYQSAESAQDSAALSGDQSRDGGFSDGKPACGA